MGLATAPPIRRGDHACCVYGSDAEQAEFVARFARDAVARRDRIFYLGDRSDEDAVRAMIDAAGIHSGAQREAGGFQYMHASDMPLRDGFDRDRQLAAWRSMTADARADGFDGLAVLAEMTWVQRWKVDLDALIDYEMVAGSVFKSGDFSALCQYDARAFDPDVLARVRGAHGHALCTHGGWSADWARLHLAQDPHARLLTIGGDIDIANIEFLESQLGELLRDGDAVADLSEVEFIDVAGCRLLRQATAGRPGYGRLELRGVPPIVTRVMTLCGFLDAG